MHNTESTAFESNLGLVYSVVLPLLRSGERAEDTPEFSDGSYGLFMATKGYKPELGFKFSTYATWCIRRAIYRGRHTRNKIKYCSIGEIENSIPVPDEVNDDLSLDKVVEFVREHCKNNWKIFKSYYLKGVSQAEIAAKYGITQQRVQQRLAKVKQQLNENFRSNLHSMNG